VRPLLAAYRRDDWSAAEAATIRRHLAACEACRRVDADFRGVGRSIRGLPSITPPADFRERVFAAIHADERHVSPALAVLSRAATDPSLPVVRLGSARPRRRELRIGPRAVLAAAAVLALTLAAARFLPDAGLGQVADRLPIPSATSTPVASLPTLAPLAGDAGWTTLLRLGADASDGAAQPASGTFSASVPYTIVLSCAGTGLLTVRYPGGTHTTPCTAAPSRDEVADVQPPSGAARVSVTTTGAVVWELLVETRE